MKTGKRSPFINVFRALHAGIAVRPQQSLLVFALAAAAAWVLQCTFCQHILPLDVVEVVTWGMQGAWGHAKHPPLSGWIANGFSLLFGRHDCGLYVAAQACILFGLWYVYRLARLFFDGKRAVCAVLLLCLVYHYNPSPMKFCTNFVEIALLPAASYYFLRALREDRLVWWLLFGGVSGLAVLGKYSALCVLFAFFLLMLFREEDRKKLWSSGPYAALAVFLIVLAPHLHWLIRHDFSCFHYVQGELDQRRCSPWSAFEVLAYALYPFLMAAVGLLFTLLPKAARQCPWRRRFQKEPFLWGVLPCLLPALPMLVCAAAGKKVVTVWLSNFGMWAPLAVLAIWPTFLSRRSVRRLFYGVLAYTVILFVALTVDVLVSPREKLHLRPGAMLAEVNRFWSRCTAAPMGAVIGERWYANCIQNYAPDHPYSADVEDPLGIDAALRQAAGRPLLLIEGAYQPIQLERFLQEYAPGSPCVRGECDVPYQAPLGKRKSTHFYFIWLPAAPAPREIR